MYLNEKAANKFSAQYSELFFENYVLLLNTYLDPYKGRVFKHGLRDVVFKDGHLVIDYTSVIDGVLMRTSDFDILRVEIPKEQYDGSYVLWNDNEVLESDLVRIKVVDIDTGEPIEIPNDSAESSGTARAIIRITGIQSAQARQFTIFALTKSICPRAMSPIYGMR